MADERGWVRGEASTRSIVWLSFALVAWACGKSARQTGIDDDAGAGGTGRGGAAANGATSGRATGGRGGSIDPTGGRAPTGGAAGRGGVSGSQTGGSSGDAGCATTEVENSLSHCPGTPLEGGQLVSTCPFEETCEALNCGDPWSDFDVDGCRRMHCTSQFECSSSERCVPAILGGELGCYSSVYEGCDPYCSVCECIVSSDCAAVAFCQPAADFPPANDCPVEDRPCDDLPYFQNMLERYLENDNWGDDVRLALESCADEVRDRTAACLGTGGAPN